MRPNDTSTYLLFSITEPGRPKNLARNVPNPEYGDRKRRIEIIEEAREQEKADGEVWDER